MIHDIVVPIGEMGLKEEGLRYVARIFPKARYHIISVVNTMGGGIQLTDLYHEEMMNSAQKEIEAATNLLGKEGIRDIETAIADGSPSKHIVRYASKNNIDLIIAQISTQHSQESFYKIDSQLRDLMKNTSVPLLLLKDQLEKVPINNILFATDGTRKSQKAKNFSIVLSSYLHATLNVLHVLRKNESKKHGMAILEDVEWKASFMGNKVVKTLERGEVLNKISDHLKDNDLLILGIEKKFLFWHLLGPIAQTLITQPSVPLILVHSFKQKGK